MLNGLNILPSYTDYFNLNAATTGLQTAAVFIGGALAPLISGVAIDRLGRRLALFWGSLIILVGVILQTAAQNIAMFVIARIVLGFGSTLSGAAGAVYLSETSPPHWRAWTVGLFNDFYYVGGLLAAGITLGTSTWNSTWAWRCPSLIQGVFSVICLVIIPFLPESPRWLAYRGLSKEAHIVLAQINADGDMNSPLVVIQFHEITEQLEWEKTVGQNVKWTQLFRDKKSLKRTALAASPAVFSVVAGNVISSYYFGTELANAGITSSTSQLQANVVLNAWSLLCSLVGTHMCAKWGRKPTGLLTQALCAIFMFLIGGLTKRYGDTTFTPGIYATVACVFLFQGSYSIGWTPLLFLYAPEIFNYSMRANGMAFNQFLNNAFATLFVYVMPIGLVNIGWKVYFINAAWDVLILLVMMFTWIETRGKSLEEIDILFEGQKHSEVPDIEDVRQEK